MTIQLESSWLSRLQDVFALPSTDELRNFLRNALKEGKHFYPPNKDIFNSFNTTPFNEVKAVILGQDPYHGKGQAHGFSFSVQMGVPIPHSLHNIFRELHNDLSIPPSRHGCLLHWAQEGVLLLNSVLTVFPNKPRSHKDRGWEVITDEAIRRLNNEREYLVFMLWGNDAQQKSSLISPERHLVLTASHPSPKSAQRSFFGCGHFSRANAYLEENGMPPINWQLPQ